MAKKNENGGVASLLNCTCSLEQVQFKGKQLSHDLMAHFCLTQLQEICPFHRIVINKIMQKHQIRQTESQTIFIS